MAIPAIIPALLTFAPFLADLLGGEKAGKVAEKAVAVASGVLGLADGSADSVEQALRTLDPGKAAELRLALAKMAHDERMADKAAEDGARRREHDELIARVTDVASARARDTALHASGHRNSRANWMIAGDVLGLIACLAALAYLATSGVKVPEVVWATLGGLVTHFGLCLRDAHNFEFGSSVSSREKTALLAAIPPAPRGGA